MIAEDILVEYLGNLFELHFFGTYGDYSEGSSNARRGPTHGVPQGKIASPMC